MVYAQPSICPGEWHTQTPVGFWHKHGSPNLWQNKRTCKIVDFAIPVDARIKLKESEKKDKYVDLARELKKLWNMEVTIIPIVIGEFGIEHKGTGGLGSSRSRGGHRNYSIIENDQNTEKSPGDLRRFAVTQTPVKDHRLTLMGKTLKE